jgi:hypothetical protein
MDTSTSVARPQLASVPSLAGLRLDREAARSALWAFLPSRLLVTAAAAVGATLPLARVTRGGSPPSLHAFHGWPLGGVLNALLSPLIRWDSFWYLQLAHSGYNGAGGVPLGVDPHSTPAFFPGYPLLVRALGGFAGMGVAVISATLVSLAAFFAGLYVLHKLVNLELGPGIARLTVALLAFSPVAYFFSAPYTESLFFLLTVSAFYAARTERFAVAGIVAAVASATRNTGILLLVPLTLLYLYPPGRPAAAKPAWRRLLPRRRLRTDFLWLLATPLGLLSFSAYLRHARGDALAWAHVQVGFERHFAGPWQGPIDGLRGALHAIEGTVTPVFTLPILLDAAFLVFAVVAIIGALRRLPIAYGLYAAAMLLPAFSAPIPVEPLRSLPRFTLVLFPLFIWLATALHRRERLKRVVLPLSGLALAFLAASFAAWYPYV